MVIIYAATIFLSAFLLFQVQPVVGKMVLPWFGGSAAVWTTCMLLFQVLLLLGYLYAHLTTRYLSPRRQAVLHVALLVAAAFTLPLSAGEGWKPSPDSDPATLLLGMLAVTVGLPYFLLSSTGPLLQHWFAGERPGSVPYRLFALSNFGSMLGLLSFPLAFEPAFVMTQIANGWSVGFIAFACLCAMLALRSAGMLPMPATLAAATSPAGAAISAAFSRSVDASAGGASIAAGRASLGAIHGAGGPFGGGCEHGASSAADIGDTGRASGESITGHAGGAGRTSGARETGDMGGADSELALWSALAAVPTVFLMAATSHLTANIAPMPLLWVLPLALYLLTFILCFESPRWYQRKLFLPLLAALTPLIIGYTNHPSLLPRGIAWPVALYCASVFVFCMCCHGELAKRKPQPEQLTTFYLMIAGGGALGGCFTALIAPRIFNDEYELALACLAALCVVAAALWRRENLWPKILLTSASLVSLMWAASVLLPEDHQVKARNFYGTVKVHETTYGQERVRQLSHGAIMHGYQFLDPAKRRWPTAYFGPDSGAGIAIKATRGAGPQKVGIVGLGAGTIAAYCQPGDTYRFYEINPLVSQLAASHFSYLADCPGKAEVVPGDARLTLEAEANQQFDLLILDAFSGDAIPVHLLTREAFATWFRHLKPGGVLAVHTSNLYLNLAPVVSKAADYYHRSAYIVSSRSNHAIGTNASQWVLIGPSERLAQSGPLRPLPEAPRQRLWTDNYSSIAGILR